MSKFLIGLGIVSFVVALFLPTVGGFGKKSMLGHDALTFSYRYGTSGTTGMFLEALLESQEEKEPEAKVGSAFLRWLSWAWLANLGILAGVVGLCISSKEFLCLLAILAVISTIDAFAGVVIPLCYGSVPEYSLGYWVWVMSLVFVSWGLMRRWRETAKA